MPRASLPWWIPCLLWLAAPACLPDDPIDEDDTVPWDDDDSEPPEPEDCPTWAPEYKVGYHREFDFQHDEPDRIATYLGLSEWQDGVYWTDEAFNVETGEVEYWVYDHCVDGSLYRIGLEKADGTVMRFNPPALQFEAGAAEGSVWEAEYNLYFRHINERYEVAGMETIEIPAGDPGWSEKKGTYRYRSADGVKPKVRLKIKTLSGMFAFKVSKLDLVATPTNPVSVALTAGEDEGAHETAWVVRKPGRLKLR